ncbi:MAG: response regulator [Candidatus Firestonebacteria bacterium]|nr:response regulator [Candidatus Firestonebacteria bacterium]
MKTLIVEDDFVSRLLLQESLKPYGPVETAENGKEGVEAVRVALDNDEPFDLICLDIMMPEMDGQTALKLIREMEQEAASLSGEASKIIVITALDSASNIVGVYRGLLCDDYLAKPLDIKKLLEELREMELIN